MTDIAYVRFVFNESSSGAILVSDLTLASDEEVLFPPIAAFEANTTVSCTGEINFTDNSSFLPTSWNWEFGDGGTATEENPTHTYTASGIYTVTLTVSNDAGTDTETITSYIEIDLPAAPTGFDAEICGPGEITVSALGSGGELSWDDEAVGGSLLGTGPDYTTSIVGTTNFYVQENIDNVLLSVGPPDNSFGSGGYFGANDLRGIFFNAYAPFTLESVRVYAGSSGNRTIEILDGEGGAVVHSTVVNIPSGESVVDLNFDIAVHDNYYMKVTGALVDLFRINDGSPSYPYEIPGVVALTGSNVLGSELDFYYFFFDWKIREADCISPRTLVLGSVLPDFDITVSDDVTIASGETTVISASGGDVYSWSPTVGLSDPDAATTNASPTETTIYTVTVTNSEGCISTEEVIVTVDGQVGLGVDAKDSFLELFPNPSLGIINIRVANIDTPYLVEVRTIDGKRVFNNIYELEESILKIDLGNLANGVYFISLKNGEINFEERIVLE
jgi:PKD repeat protein